MRLVELSYKDKDWELRNLKLGEVNLIVGKNGVGKSRSLVTTTFLGQLTEKNNNITQSFSLFVKFQDGQNDIFEYSIKMENKQVLLEELKYNNNLVVERDQTNSKIQSILTSEFNTVYLPTNELSFNVHRDTANYPFLEKIYSWTQFMVFISFARIIPQIPDYNNFAYRLGYLFKSLSLKSRETIIKELNRVGYDIENISIHEQGDLIFLDITERHIEKSISFHQLSQGTFRTLFILTLLENIIELKNTRTLAIDDFCEGLDYERVIKLGKIVFQKCKEHNIQLIASSNDNFLMDVVDIEHWNILQREGNMVTAINKESHPKLFDNFKFTGLSNFDFFATDYLKLRQKML